MPIGFLLHPGRGSLAEPLSVSCQADAPSDPEEFILPCFPILLWLERMVYYLLPCQVAQYRQTARCQLFELFSSGTM